MSREVLLKEIKEKAHANGKSEELYKIVRKRSMSIMIEKILCEMLTPVLAILILIAGIYTDLLQQIEGTVPHFAIIILVFSLAFYNIARGIKKIQEAFSNKKDNEDD